MSTLEINKIAGAILAALLTVTVIGHLGNALIHSDALEENVYVVAALEEDAGEAADQGAAEAEETVTVLLGSADPAAGQKVAKKCAACHDFKKGGPNKVGPNLWGIVSAAMGGVPGFAYSDAIAGLGGTWTYEDLDAYLTNPKAFAPGTKMIFAGLKKVKQRADLIAWLRTLSDSPVPLPEVRAEPAAEATTEAAATDAAPAAEEPESPDPPETAAAEAPQSPDVPDAGGTQVAAVPDPEFLGLLGAADPEQGKAIAKKCTACHHLAKGAGKKIGPPLWGVVGRLKGSLSDFKYSKAMAAAGGSWGYDDLNAFITQPRAFVPGTKMGFPGLKSVEDRARVIAYLRTLSDSPPPLPE